MRIADRQARVKTGKYGILISVSPPRSAAFAAQPGDLLGGRYRIVRPIGRGSMADVFEARDTTADVDVAVKVLRGTVSRSSEHIQRFGREARAQQKIQQRNVARLFDVGVTDTAVPYLVVELLRGRSLRDVLRGGHRVDAVRAASYAWQALQGLAATHAAGVLHRDLKPANLMLEPSPGPVERVVLIDFGFAALSGATKLTRQGQVVGSLSYLAPERLTGGPGDERSDLYAIGVILYELLVGRRPFASDDDMQLINDHLQTVPVPPRTAAPEAGIPPGLEAVVLRALAKSPDERAPSAGAMAEDLDRAAQEVVRSGAARG
jgi:serine/threonine-protein kinase